MVDDERRALVGRPGRRGHGPRDAVPARSAALLTLPGAPAIAVELELSDKTTEGYGRIRRWYGAALGYQRDRWFCATPALVRKVADLVDREGMGDFVEM